MRCISDNRIVEVQKKGDHQITVSQSVDHVSWFFTG